MRISGLNSWSNFGSFAHVMLCGVVLSIQSWQLQHHALGFTSLGSTLQRSGSLKSTCVQCVHNGIASSSFCSGPNASFPIPTYPTMLQSLTPTFQRELLAQSRFFCNWCVVGGACLKLHAYVKSRPPLSEGSCHFEGG